MAGDPLAARLVELPLEQLRAILEDYKRGTQAEPICAGVGKHKRARDRFEVETIHKTLNVVIGEIDRLQAGRLVDPPPDIERELRIEWWLNHGLKCMPYGDDGEMQCCALDFKRMPLDELRPRVNELRLKRISESIQQAARVDPSPLAQRSENNDDQARVDKGVNRHGQDLPQPPTE